MHMLGLLITIAVASAACAAAVSCAVQQQDKIDCGKLRREVQKLCALAQTFQ